MRGSHVGRSYNPPLRIEPQAGKIGEHSVEPESNVSCDVLQHDEPGSKNANGSLDGGPKVPRVGLSLSLSCLAERLAGIAGVQHVDPLESCVDFPHVGQHWDSGPVALEDGSAVRVGFAKPGRFTAESGVDGEVESADAGAEGGCAHVTPSRLWQAGRGVLRSRCALRE